MSDQKYVGVFFDIFGYMHDRRQEGKVLHMLIDVIFIAVQVNTWSGKNE